MFIGPLDSIVSNRSSVFTSEYQSTFCYYLIVKKKLSTTFYLQTNRQTERQNQQFKSYLCIYYNYDQNDQTCLLYTTTFVYNLKVYISYSYSSIKLAIGTQLFILNSIQDKYSIKKRQRIFSKLVETATIQLLKRQNEFEVTKHSLEKVVQLQTKYYNCYIQTKHFDVSEQVLLLEKNIYSKRLYKKLDNKQLSLFRIFKRISKQAYKLNLPPSIQRLYLTFYILLLKLYKPRSSYQLLLVNNLNNNDKGQNLRQEVEKVVNYYIISRKRLYYIRQLDYSPEDNQELELEDLSSIEEVLLRYC